MLDRLLRWLFIPDGPLEFTSPDHDPPGAPSLRQVLFIASTPRSGSTLLASGLTESQVAGMPREYLHPAGSYLNWRRRFSVPVPTTRGALGMLKRRAARQPDWWKCDRWRPASLRQLLDHIVAVRTTPNGVFAIKVHFDQCLLWETSADLGLTEWGVPVRWVSLERDDVIAQAVSLTLAMQTGKWRSTFASHGDAIYSADEVERSLTFILAGRRGWREWFADHHIEPLAMTYEELTADYDGGIRAVLALVGETVEPVPAPHLAQQASTANQRWIEQFSLDRPDVVRAVRGDDGA